MKRFAVSLKTPISTSLSCIPLGTPEGVLIKALPSNEFPFMTSSRCEIVRVLCCWLDWKQESENLRLPNEDSPKTTTVPLTEKNGVLFYLYPCYNCGQCKRLVFYLWKKIIWQLNTERNLRINILEQTKFIRKNFRHQHNHVLKSCLDKPLFQILKMTYSKEFSAFFVYGFQTLKVNKLIFILVGFLTPQQ